MRNNRLWLLLGVALVLLCVTACGARVYSSCFASHNGTADYAQLCTLLESAVCVRAHYADPERIAGYPLFQAAATGLVESIDPFSHYLTAEEARAFLMRQTQDYCGIGLELGVNAYNEIAVVAVQPKSPAEYAGIKVDDVVLSIDAVRLSGADLSRCSRLMYGPKHSAAEVGIRRADNRLAVLKVPREPVLVRDVVGPAPVESDSKLHYVRINRFSAGVSDDLQRVLETLDREGTEGLVLDLSSCPGGELREALRVSSLFLKSDLLLTSLHHGDGRVESFKSEPGKKFLHVPLAVIIDPMTASAAEIVASALKDYERALVIGQPSFGKGIAQTQFPLSGGGMLYLSTAFYQTARGYSIHLRGVEPDFYCKSTEADLALYRRSRALTPGKIHLAGTAKTDEVLRMAVEQLLLSKSRVR